jgi:restriction endonuclease S subunit
MTSWLTKKLGEVCEIIRGSEPGSESYFDEINEERIRFIRVGDISGKVDQPKFIDKQII